MQTAPCPHCGTPNLTNLVVCYYCGRHLAPVAHTIPDDLPDYFAPPQLNELLPSKKVQAVFTLSGLALTFFIVPVGFLALHYLFWPLLFGGLISGGVGLLPLLFSPFLIVAVGIFFSRWFSVKGPIGWAKFLRWCGEVQAHCDNVRAGRI
jgi:hypothetical protein